jgi:hypothetical protein
MAWGPDAVGSARSKRARRVPALAMSRFLLKPMLGFALLLAAALLSLKQEDKSRFSRGANQALPKLGQVSSKPSPSSIPVDQFRVQQVLDQLASADLQWIPKAELLPNGSTRYSYKRRGGEPTLSIDEIRGLMQHPPTFSSERQSISRLWQVLEAKGVKIRITKPRKLGAAGEWDPNLKTIRIKPEVLDKGSKEFAWVLNHEAIHVAQSCKSGSITANPNVLGLAKKLTPEVELVLQKPPYLNASFQSKSLEREAFASQRNLSLGPSLVDAYCF